MGETLNEQQIDPLLVSQRIREDYERYVETAFPMKNESLRHQFREMLRRRDFLVRGPYLEATPPFENGRSIRELAEAGVFCRSMADLDGPGFPGHGYPIDRSLYRHQEQAITKIRIGRNVVVATGTGSGKTEAFLLPIIDHLLCEHEAGTLRRPGGTCSSSVSHERSGKRPAQAAAQATTKLTRRHLRALHWPDTGAPGHGGTGFPARVSQRTAYRK